jgi:hypothetical protein
MSVEPTTSARQPAKGTEAQLQRENALLRERLRALEQELVEAQARADAQVAHWQERAYWLERWHLDLNAIMRRPAAQRSLQALKVMRALYRTLKRAKRRLAGSS